VSLPRKAFDLLELLVTERPRALSKEQIRDRVWPRTFVSESTLNSLIGELRAALGDDAHAPRFIRTLHGFGYAFAGEVAEEQGAVPGAPGPGSRLPQDPAPPPTDSAQAVVARGSPALLTARLLWEDRLIPLSPGENVLGRDEDVNVRIDAPSVSRRHARLVVAAGAAATLQDLGSKNGTWVAGRRVENEAALKDGDVLRLGKIELVFLDSKDKGSTQTVAS
jgi:DNA-binding winged helix-turn-helix (wHTH) protein